MKLLKKMNPEDWTVLTVDGFAIFGAFKAVPGLAWYAWILPGIFTGLGLFYLWGKYRYDIGEYS